MNSVYNKITCLGGNVFKLLGNLQSTESYFLRWLEFSLGVLCNFQLMYPVLKKKIKQTNTSVTVTKITFCSILAEGVHLNGNNTI